MYLKQESNLFWSLLILILFFQRMFSSSICFYTSVLINHCLCLFLLLGCAYHCGLICWHKCLYKGVCVYVILLIYDLWWTAIISVCRNIAWASFSSYARTATITFFVNKWYGITMPSLITNNTNSWLYSWRKSFGSDGSGDGIGRTEAALTPYKLHLNNLIIFLVNVRSLIYPFMSKIEYFERENRRGLIGTDNINPTNFTRMDSTNLEVYFRPNSIS